MLKGTGFDLEYEAGLSEIESCYKGQYHVAPTGTVFVNKSVRVGLLVKMVSEILQIRYLLKLKIMLSIFIKTVLKNNRNHPLYEHYEALLNYNQLALKGIVNTTYG
jgi:hypothetical protein